MGQLAEGLLGLSGWTALAFLFVLPALEAPAFLGLVLPGEVALILGGVLAAQDRIPLAAALAVGTAGALAGDTAGYWIGRRWGPRLLATRLGRRVGPARLHRVESLLTKGGGGPLFVGRCTAGSGSCSPAWPACSACATGSSRPGPGRPRPSGRWPTSCSASPPGPAGATSTSSPAGSAWPWPWPSWSPGPSAGCVAGQVEVA
jgi:membrane protein YqaA with SNARE-associated domain